MLEVAVGFSKTMTFVCHLKLILTTKFHWLCNFVLNLKIGFSFIAIEELYTRKYNKNKNEVHTHLRILFLNLEVAHYSV